MIIQNKNQKTFVQKILAFLLVLCITSGITGPIMSDGITALAAAPASYTTITTNSTSSVSITSSGSAQYFKFVPAKSGTYKFYSSNNSSSDPKCDLLDANGNTLASNDDGALNYNFSITYACTGGTTYYIKAYLYSNTGSYTLNVTTISIDCEHNYVLQSTTAADCENDGVATYVCSLCNETSRSTVASALGHNYVNGACTRCGATDYANVTCINITAAGGKNYSLFNSGRTGIGSNTTGSLYDDALNPAPTTYKNRGYDIYVRANTNNSYCSSESQVGLSFYIDVDVDEKSQLVIYAYDVDEEQGEVDGIYLVNETTGVETRLGALSGMNEDWYNTSFEVPAELLNKGNTYNIKVKGEYDTWCVYIRTVNLIVNGSNAPIPTPTTGIENADLNASISSSGLITANLTANAYTEAGYTLEYKAVCSSNMAQYGGKEYSVTVPTTSTLFNTTFQLESGSPRGTYEITIFIKDSAGNVIATRTATASYGYSAVSYNANGGSQNIPTDGTTYSSGNTVTVKFDYIPSMYGYNFLGWSTDRNATEPTYTQNGTKTFTIGSSDVTLYAVWALAVHEHEWTETSRTQATCTTDGRINYACSCGETKFDIIQAQGHNIQTIIQTAVTCTTDGLIIDRCANDGCTYEKRTVVHGSHNYSITDRKEATCNTSGYIEYTCSNCQDKQYEYFEGKHNYVETARVEPAVNVEGSVTYTCTACNDSYSIVLPALTPVLKNSSVLLIQDSLPWAEDVNRTLLNTLKSRGVVSSYNIITTSALANFDLSQYGVVFIANDQSTATYNRLATNATKLENYVRAGGNLIYGACDEGWGGCGSLTHDLPGGVKTSNYYSVHNYIVNELHPVVTGVYTDNKSLKDELLKGNYCSHTYFHTSSLPVGTNIILRDANGNPTLVEYSLGEGTVMASGLTWEYFYVRNHYNMATNYSKYVFDDLLTYMVYMSNTCEHNYQVAETVNATCEESGYTKYVCSICSHEYKGNIVAAFGHNFVETSRTDGTCVVAGEVVYTCACGATKTEQTGYAEHIEGDWIVDVAPTATQTGSRHKECTVCNALIKTDVMPVLAKLVIDNVEAEAGKTITVAVNIQNNPGIIGAVLTLNYDPALTLTKAEAGNAWGSLNFTTPPVFSNPCNFVWDGVVGADYENGTVLVLTFDLPNNAEVGTVYNISASYTYGNMINANLETVNVEIVSGSITVYSSLGDVNKDGVINVVDVILLRRYLVGGYEVVIDESTADMNGDGIITIADVVLLRRLLVD